MLLKPVPAVKVDPLLKLIEFAALPVSLCAPWENVIEPATRAVDPAAMLRVRAIPVSMLSDDPEAMSKQLVPPLSVSVPVGFISKVTFVPPPTEIAPIVVPGGTLVSVVVAPLLKARMSSVAGAERVGVQFVEVVYEAVPV